MLSSHTNSFEPFEHFEGSNLTISYWIRCHEDMSIQLKGGGLSWHKGSRGAKGLTQGILSQRTQRVFFFLLKFSNPTK